MHTEARPKQAFAIATYGSSPRCRLEPKTPQRSALTALQTARLRCGDNAVVSSKRRPPCIATTFVHRLGLDGRFFVHGI